MPGHQAYQYLTSYNQRNKSYGSHIILRLYKIVLISIDAVENYNSPPDSHCRYQSIAEITLQITP